MEHYFDHQFQFFKQFDVKAQGKPPRRKKWLLSREYLQPLTEPDDEENSLGDLDEDSNGYKKKLKCAYEAARYGMKEGVLTGVFLGSETIDDELNGQKSKSDIRSEKPTANTMKKPVSSKQTRSISATNQDNISTYTKSVSVVRNRSPEKNYYNATTNQLVYSSTNSKLPIRNDKRLPPLRAGGTGLFETNKYNFKRSREKVEIVGYAFIQTTGSITGSSNDGSTGQKKTVEDTEKNEENSRKNSSDKTSATGSRNRSKGSQETPQKNDSDLKNSEAEKDIPSSTTSPRQSVKKTVGSSSEKLISSSGSIHSQPLPRGIKHSKSTLPDTLEEIPNSTSVQQQSDFRTSTQESLSSNNGKTDFQFSNFNLQENRVKDESEILLSSSLSSWAYSKAESKDGSIGTIKVSDSLSYNDANESALQTESVIKGKQSRKKNKKESREPPYANQNNIGYENIYPDSKKVGGILVDIDAISNGFTSPPTVTQSEKSSYIKFTENQQPVPYATPKQSTAKTDSEPKNLKLNDSDTSYDKIENHGIYTAETSPSYFGSFVSANKYEGRRVDASLTNSTRCGSYCQNERYVVESSPTYKRSHATMGHDVRKKESNGSSYTPETQISSGKSPSYYKYYDSEVTARGGSPQSPSFVSETSTAENSSPLYNGNHVRRERSTSGSRYEKLYINETPTAEDRSSPSHKKYTRETSPTESYNKRVPYESYPKTHSNETYAASGGNVSYHKSYVNETEDKRKHSLESTFTNKSYTSGSYERDKRSDSVEISQISNRYYLGETQQEKSLSSDYSAYDRSHGNDKTADDNSIKLSSSPTYTKSYSSHLQGDSESSSVHKRTHTEAEDVRRYRSRTSDASTFAYEQVSPTEQSIVAKPEYSTPRFQRSSHSYMRAERETSASRTSGSILKGVGLISETPSPRKVQSEKKNLAVEKAKEKTELVEPTEKERSTRGFNFLSAVNENIIILSACNCAIVLGIVCSIISTTRASLAV